MQGAAVGAVATMVVGFYWGGWSLRSTADKLAKERSEVAVVAALAPVCAEKFIALPDSAAKKGMEHGLEKVEVFAKGAGSGRETAIRSLQAAGLEVTGVKDVTPQAHNGCRPRKRRRV